MKHAHPQKCHLLSKELKLLNSKDQVNHVSLTALSHVISYTGRGRGGKVQGGGQNVFLYSYKLVNVVYRMGRKS